MAVFATSAIKDQAESVWNSTAWALRPEETRMWVRVGGLRDSTTTQGTYTHLPGPSRRVTG